MIYSATYGTDAGASLDPHVVRQTLYAVFGCIALVILVGFDYRLLGSFAVPLYIAGTAALVLVMVLGRLDYGARRWIDFGFFQLQPSEPVKLIVAIALARYFAVNRERIHRFTTLLGSLAIAMLPFLLTLLEPDLGTALVFLAIWFVTAYAGGVRWRHLVVIGAAGGAAIPVVWEFLPAYMRSRVYIFLDPYSRPLEEGYNVIQAQISVGSGGLFGRGFLSGTQSQLHFLRVQYADFIFSVLAEELGFVGAMALFALFAILLLRGLRSAYLASEPFGRLLAVGIVGMILFQLFVNVGMNISILPVAGIPLPFISFGGSSLITFMAAIGILESITMRHRKFQF
jgi:rod shape determining protein RodA